MKTHNLPSYMTEQNPSNCKKIDLSKLHHCLSFSNIMMTVLVYAWFSTVLIAASPLPGILEYQQQIVLKCASAEDAAKVELVPLPLPDNAPIAFSARWDDCNMKHLDTLAVMAENGVKGTFYLNGTRFGTDYCKKLLRNGCTIGAHTQTHPSLPALNANEQFYEIMSVRVQRESDSDSILSTMVLPYCQYKKFEDPQIQLDIGQSMMNSGFIGAPEPFYGHYGKDLGYPSGTLAESALIRPGDRDVNPEKSDKDMHKYLAAKDLLKRNPALTIGIHSWHTP
ncbi:MAG: polysaccharide deacetylase family protein, partial [Victivallales bacterium]|nr:polysaccharide deacetylase family protein [Victivallales bacterium]